MSAEQALFDAYREWRRLARAAQKAISRRDWKFFFECQNIIQKNQPFISDLTEEVRKEWKRQKVSCAAKEKELCKMISDLMRMLESNQQLLQTMRAAAMAKREELEQAGRNLKRLQDSYVLTRTPAWTSFS
jgi:hypothetical protein